MNKIQLGAKIILLDSENSRLSAQNLALRARVAELETENENIVVLNLATTRDLAVQRNDLRTKLKAAEEQRDDLQAEIDLLRVESNVYLAAGKDLTAKLQAAEAERNGALTDAHRIIAEERNAAEATVEAYRQRLSPAISCPIGEFLGPAKPCPFCGSEGINVYEGQVECGNCGANAEPGPWQFRDTREIDRLQEIAALKFANANLTASAMSNAARVEELEEGLKNLRSKLDADIGGDGDCCYVPDDSSEDHTPECVFGIIAALLGEEK